MKSVVTNLVKKGQALLKWIFNKLWIIMRALIWSPYTFFLVVLVLLKKVAKGMWATLKWVFNKLWAITRILIGGPFTLFVVNLQLWSETMVQAHVILTVWRGELSCGGEMQKQLKKGSTYVIKNQPKNWSTLISDSILWIIYSLAMFLISILRAVLVISYMVLKEFMLDGAQDVPKHSKDFLKIIMSSHVKPTKKNKIFWYSSILGSCYYAKNPSVMWSFLEDKLKSLQLLEENAFNKKITSPKSYSSFIWVWCVVGLNMMPIGIVIFIPWLLKTVISWVVCSMWGYVMLKFRLLLEFVKAGSLKSTSYEEGKVKAYSTYWAKVKNRTMYRGYKYNTLMGITMMIFAGPSHSFPEGGQMAWTTLICSEAIVQGNMMMVIPVILDLVPPFSVVESMKVPEATEEMKQLFISGSPENLFSEWGVSDEPIIRQGDKVICVVKNGEAAIGVESPHVRKVWSSGESDPYKIMWEKRAMGVKEKPNKCDYLVPGSEKYLEMKKLVDCEMSKSFPYWKEKGLKNSDDPLRLYFVVDKGQMNYKIETNNISVWGKVMKVEVERPNGLPFKSPSDGVNMVSNSIKSGKFLPGFQTNISVETQMHIFSDIKLEPCNWSDFFEGKLEWMMSDMKLYPNSNPEWQAIHDSNYTSLLENMSKSSREKGAFVCNAFDYIKNSVTYTSKGRTEEEINNEIGVIKEFISSYEKNSGSKEILAEATKLNDRTLDLQKENKITAKCYANCELKKAKVACNSGDLIAQASYMNKGSEDMINSRKGVNVFVDGMREETVSTWKSSVYLEKECKTQYLGYTKLRHDGLHLDIETEKAVTNYNREIMNNSAVQEDFDKFRLRLKDMCCTYGMTYESLQGYVEDNKSTIASQMAQEPSTSQEDATLGAESISSYLKSETSANVVTDSMRAKADEWEFDLTESNLASSAELSSDPSAAGMADSESSDLSPAFLSFNDKVYSVKPHLVEYSGMSSSDDSNVLGKASPKPSLKSTIKNHDLSPISGSFDSISSSEGSVRVDTELNSTGPYFKPEAKAEPFEDGRSSSDPDSLSTVPSEMSEHPNCNKKGGYKFYSSDSQSNKEAFSLTGELYSSGSQSGKTPSTSSPRSSGNETLNDPGVSVINQESLSFEDASSNLSDTSSVSFKSPCEEVGFSSFNDSLFNQSGGTSVEVNLEASTSSNIDEITSFSNKFVNKYQDVKSFKPTGKGCFETENNLKSPDKFVNPFKSEKSLETGKYFSEANKK
nr:hypothetical protein [Donax vittatus]